MTDTKSSRIGLSVRHGAENRKKKLIVKFIKMNMLMS